MSGQYLLPATLVLPDIIEDADLDQLFQDAVSQVSGLPSTSVLVRFETDPDAVPRRPEVTDNWCAISVMTSTSDDSPVIEPAVVNGLEDVTQVKYSDHEQLEVLASFYGPKGAGNAKRFRDGIKIPQNMEALEANLIYFQDATTVRRVPELVNQQWQNRWDLPLTFRRKIERLYPIERFLIILAHVFDDHPAEKTVFDRVFSLTPPNP